MTLSALRRAAEQATPGPWVQDGNSVMCDAPILNNHICTTGEMDMDGDQAAIAKYIALCDPQTVLKLIAAVEALQKITSMGSNTDPWPVEVEMRKVARRALQELGL